MGDFDAACWHSCKWLQVYDGSEPCADCNLSNDFKHYEQKNENISIKSMEKKMSEEREEVKVPKLGGIIASLRLRRLKEKQMKKTSGYKYRNRATGTEYMNLDRALDEAEDQNDIEIISDE